VRATHPPNLTRKNYSIMDLGLCWIKPASSAADRLPRILRERLKLPTTCEYALTTATSNRVWVRSGALPNISLRLVTGDRRRPLLQESIENSMIERVLAIARA
jgi:hypothetical protein